MDMREMNMWRVRGSAAWPGDGKAGMPFRIDRTPRPSMRWVWQDSTASQAPVPQAARAAAREVGFVP